jgi:hypothetical protein
MDPLWIRVISWLAKPKTWFVVIVLGYISIIFGWLVVTAYKQQPSAAATTPSTPPGSQPQMEEPSFLKRCADGTVIPMSVWSVIAALGMFVSPYITNRYEKSLRLRKTQKERIRVLTDFEPTRQMIAFYDNRSIYKAIIALLERLSKELDTADDKSRRHVCMLLCSPALDYPGNPKSYSPDTRKFEWGYEFRNRVKDLAADTRVHFDICHLPLTSLAGINPMKDFIAVLSNYVVRCDDDFERVFKSLWNRAAAVASDFQSWATDDDTRSRFRVQTHNINIPFQIVLVNSDDFTELVVSFAGRDVLERERKYGVKGFFSSDPYVVRTFHEVFKTYVDPRDRIPYIPLHTRSVAKQHTDVGDHHISSFYSGYVKNLRVTGGTFSPALGNSTKFTMWVLDKLLTTGRPDIDTHWCTSIRRILDVGSGTGVLAIGASAILSQRLEVNDYSIVAIDSCPHAQRLLRTNCATDSKIVVHPWALRYQPTDQGGIVRAWIEDENNMEVKVGEDFGKFNLVLGDLPFVHARKRNDSDLRFLDHRHLLHQALMWVSTNTDLLAKDGLLVTAFSSLGGPEDIADFEKHICENSLQVIQRVDFYESEYMWMVYVLMRRGDFRAHLDRLWWNILEAGDYRRQPAKSSD